MEVTDYSKEYKDKPLVGKHSALFPKNWFCVIAGATGCGKIILLTNLLRKASLKFSDFYIYCATVHQDAFANLRKHFEEQEKAMKLDYTRRFNREKIIKNGHFFDNDGDILDSKDLDPNLNHVIVFDDVLLKDQQKIKEYFCTGRHNNVNVFYLVQSLFKIQKHCIRENTNTRLRLHY